MLWQTSSTPKGKTHSTTIKPRIAGEDAISDTYDNVDINLSWITIILQLNFNKDYKVKTSFEISEQQWMKDILDVSLVLRQEVQ